MRRRKVVVVVVVIVAIVVKIIITIIVRIIHTKMNCTEFFASIKSRVFYRGDGLWDIDRGEVDTFIKCQWFNNS